MNSNTIKTIMKAIKERFSVLLAVFALAGFPTLASAASTDDSEAAGDKPGTIVEVASEGGFSTLVAAVKAAGLVETLQGSGPFTVFAPTDEAFAKLPEGTVENLLKPENKDKLIAILTYHVVPGRVTSDQVGEINSATTVEGSDLRVAATDGGVRINDANVIAADVAASNGVIHVIDAVLLPSAH